MMLKRVHSVWIICKEENYASQCLHQRYAHVHFLVFRGCLYFIFCCGNSYAERQTEEQRATPSLPKVLCERGLTYLGIPPETEAVPRWKLWRKAKGRVEGEIGNNQLFVWMTPPRKRQTTELYRCSKRPDKIDGVCQDHDVGYHQEWWRQQVTGIWCSVPQVTVLHNIIIKISQGRTRLGCTDSVNHCQTLHSNLKL